MKGNGIRISDGRLDGSGKIEILAKWPEDDETLYQVTTLHIHIRLLGPILRS
jgi:hypothetical protein